MEGSKTTKGVEHGTSLIEVMVSLIVLTAGLLGMTALQGVSAQFGNKAYFRTQAIEQTYDLIDRMRGNPKGLSTGSYVRDPMPASYPVDCAAEACSPFDLAVYDLVEWNTRNADLLPEGNGTLTQADGVYSVRVAWRETSRGQPEAGHILVRIRL